MPKLAENVVLRRVGSHYELTIDGNDFPWFCAADPAPQAGPIGPNDMPTITLTLIAERVEVEHAVKDATEATA